MNDFATLCCWASIFVAFAILYGLALVVYLVVAWICGGGKLGT